MTLIQLTHANIGVADKKLLTDVNFTVSDGEFVYIIGPVGSGKSTLLKTLYGECPLSSKTNTGDAPSGTIFDIDLYRLRRKQLPQLRKQLGIVFQSFQLLADRSVYDNLDFVLRATGWRRRAARETRIMQVLEMVHLADRAAAFPHQLSGGEQQRITIARALLNKPQIILADEPTANLDAKATDEVMNILRDATARGCAVVMVTHNLDLLRHYPGIVYQCEEGRVVLSAND